MSASLFEPGQGLTDDLTGATPTWRLDEQPIHDQLVADWPAIYARLCAPVTEAPAADVVEGVVLDGPPTLALTLVPTVALDLDATQPLPAPAECDDCPATGDEPCRTPTGKPRISDHQTRIRGARASKAVSA